MPRLLSTLILLGTLLSSAPLAAQRIIGSPIDFTGNRKVDLTAYSNFQYSVKSCPILWIERNIGDNIASASKGLNGSVISHFITSYSGVIVVLDKVNIVTADKVDAALPNKIDPKNNKERGFLFLAPATGEYQIRISVPGGSSAPRTTIELYSSANTTASLIDYNNVPNSSGATQTFWVTLQEGVVYGLKVTSSATVVGYLDSVTLNSPTYVTWTWTGIPTCTDKHTLLDYLPNPPRGKKSGSSCTIPLVYPQNPAGKIYLHSPANGYFTILTPYGGSYSDPLQSIYKLGTIHIYGPPTPEEEALIAGGPYGIHLDYQETSTPQVDTAARTIYFFFQREADFTSYWTYHVIRHLW